jgi:hypothetical protein
MEYYPLTWFKIKTNTEIGTEKNHTIIQQIEYQKYLNTKDNMLKTKLKGM